MIGIDLGDRDEPPLRIADERPDPRRVYNWNHPDAFGKRFSCFTGTVARDSAWGCEENPKLPAITRMKSGLAASPCNRGLGEG